jgi:hypothetical protein
MCTIMDSTICFCILTPYTGGVAEVEKMSGKENPLRYEYLLNHKWAVARMIQSYDWDEKRAYIHGFDAGIDLLCTKAKLSKPEIAESVKELAGKIAEETAETLRSVLGTKKVVFTRAGLRGK